MTEDPVSTATDRSGRTAAHEVPRVGSCETCGEELGAAAPPAANERKACSEKHHFDGSGWYANPAAEAARESDLRAARAADRASPRRVAMADDPVFQAELRAIERLGWTAQQVFVAAIEYGNVGTAADVAEHLRTGDHLPAEKKALIAAALWDAEVANLQD